MLAAVEAGEVGEHDLDAAVTRLLALGEWAGAGSNGTAEVTADDADTRAVIRRGAARAMVLLKNDDDVLPVAPATTRVALIGPYARYGRPQGGGSARVRPDHGRGPLEALEARGLDVTFEPGGSITKYLPTVRGEFSVALSDDHGGSATIQANRLSWFWDQPPVAGIDATGFGAHIAGAFIPDATGDWELGVRAVGPVTAAARRGDRRRAGRGPAGRGVLRHGQPGGAGHGRAGGRSPLRAGGRLPEPPGRARSAGSSSAPARSRPAATSSGPPPWLRQPSWRS